MKNIIGTTVVFTLIVLAVLGVWRWGPSADGPSKSGLSDEGDTNLALGPENMARSEADPNGRIDPYARGDSLGVIESARIFKEASDCLLYHSALHELSAFRDDDRLDDLSSATLATLQGIDATSNRYLSIVRETERRCAGSDREALARVYEDAILRAALLGDPDAQSCFVIGPLSPVRINSDESLAYFEKRYVKHAPEFTRRALERGDPRVAANALQRYVASPSLHHTLLDDTPKADPFLTWRMARLASLRALPEQRALLEERLNMFEALGLLQPDEISQADEWARASYEREFADQPQVDLSSQEPCYSSPDLAP